jgi:hypothetical protein
MSQVEQNLEALFYRLPGIPPVYPRDEPHPASIVLV